MKTINLNLYSFEELNPKAQTKALEWGRNVLSEDYNPDYLLEEWKTKLEALGYENAKIMYSGFYSQGSGAGFTATGDYHTWLKAHKLSNKFRALYNIASKGLTQGFNIDHVGTYYHKHSFNLYGGYTYLDSENTENTPADKQIDQVDVLIETHRLNLCDELFTDLVEDYEDTTSDESVKGMIEANEYLFTEDGTYYPTNL